MRQAEFVAEFPLLLHRAPQRRVPGMDPRHHEVLRQRALVQRPHVLQRQRGGIHDLRAGLGMVQHLGADQAGCPDHDVRCRDHRGRAQCEQVGRTGPGPDEPDLRAHFTASPRGRSALGGLPWSCLRRARQRRGRHLRGSGGRPPGGRSLGAGRLHRGAMRRSARHLRRSARHLRRSARHLRRDGWPFRAAVRRAGHSLAPRRVRRPGTSSVDRYGAGPVTSAAGRMSSPGRPRLAPCTAPSRRPASRTAASTSGRWLPLL